MPIHPIAPPADVARKYLALVERSRANLTDLYDSGRWKHYYSEAELVTRARELAGLRDKWAAVAALAGNGLPSLERWGASGSEPAEAAEPASPT
jgi:hypothetical protein